MIQKWDFVSGAVWIYFSLYLAFIGVNNEASLGPGLRMLPVLGLLFVCILLRAEARYYRSLAKKPDQSSRFSPFTPEERMLIAGSLGNTEIDIRNAPGRSYLFAEMDHNADMLASMIAEIDATEDAEKGTVAE